MSDNNSGQIANSTFGTESEFSKETACIFLYRLGIGEIRLSPYNVVVSEAININQEINESLYAKTNPIVSYTNTTRKFTLSFLITDNTIYSFLGEGNLQNQIKQKSLMNITNLFKSFLYANYDRKVDTTNLAIYARTIKSPPVFKLKFQNFISNGDGSFPKLSDDGIIAKNSGLLGFITNFKLEPTYNPLYKPDNSSKYYSQIKVSFDYIPIFEEPVGWEIGGTTTNFSNIKELGGLSSTNVISKILGRINNV